MQSLKRKGWQSNGNLVNLRVRMAACEAGRRRRQNGQAQTEFAPAMMILVIFLFFPLIDLISMGVSYGCCMVLNTDQAHEASLSDWNKAEAKTMIEDQLVNVWASSGLGKFVRLGEKPATQEFFRNGQTGPDGVTDKIVMISTTFKCNPFLSIPIPWLNLPGLNAQWTFNVSAERPMENPDFAPPHP
jgi:hypothetical protein